MESAGIFGIIYSEVPNRRADRNKRAGLEKNSSLPAFLLSKLINEQGGIFCLLHGKLQSGWKKSLKNLSEHSILLGSSEYSHISLAMSHGLPNISCALLSLTLDFPMIKTLERRSM